MPVIDGRMQSLFESVTSAQPKIIPEEPVDFIEFKKLPQHIQAQKVDFHRQEHIKKYFDDKWVAQLHNRDAVLWLCDYRDHNSPTEEQREAIDVKIRLFLRVIRPQSNVYPALRLDLQKLGVMHL